MARPIQPTPTLRGEDARRLLRDLENVCPPTEAKRRIERARTVRAEMMRPKVSTGSKGAEPRSG